MRNPIRVFVLVYIVLAFFTFGHAYQNMDRNTIYGYGNQSRYVRDDAEQAWCAFVGSIIFPAYWSYQYFKHAQNP